MSRVTNFVKDYFAIPALLILAGAVLARPSEDGSKDWPQYRGQNHNGLSTAPDIFKFDEGYGVKVAWRKPLGSGYSSVSVADDRVVTMFSDSTFDYMVTNSSRKVCLL